MIIPSIDLQNGQAVQLIGGRDLKIAAGDPSPIARRFAYAGEIAVIDLDAATGAGSNEPVARELLASAPCRVGGGIRDEAAAWRWLEAGAAKIILGTAAEAALLRRLPASRIIAALDAIDGEVVVEGWRTRTGRGVIERIDELREFVGGFLVTFVEREGGMGGLPIENIAPLVEAAGGRRVTIAGGVRDTHDIAQATALGVDVQIGMALYTGAVSIADAIWATVRPDPATGLVPTVVADERGAALGLVYSSKESVAAAVECGAGVYWSRSRDRLWIKGDSSGDTQELISIRPDCDGDALLFTVRQRGNGFCHLGMRTCFGESGGLAGLERKLRDRKVNDAPGSFTAKLLADPSLLREKLVEEAGELADADNRDNVIWEAADSLYFTLCAMARAGVTLEEVERELDRRSDVPKGAADRAGRNGR